MERLFNFCGDLCYVVGVITSTYSSSGCKLEPVAKQRSGVFGWGCAYTYLYSNDLISVLRAAKSVAPAGRRGE